MKYTRDWIQSYTGKQLWLPDLPIENICLEDIAHSLSQLCRFGGHCREFYSVAQHCVLVSYLCDKDDAREGLGHDFSEYIMIDLPRPIKHMTQFQPYRDIEDANQITIAQRFDFKYPEPKSVKHADAIALATEKRDLMFNSGYRWAELPEPNKDIIVPLLPKDAERLFLERCEELDIN